MAEKVQDFLDVASILDAFISSFHPGHGTDTTLVTLTDDLWRLLDLGGLVLLVLLDLTATFNMVSYDLLMCYFVDIRIPRSALQWLYSFLHGQGQRIVSGKGLFQQHLWWPREKSFP